MTLGKWANTDWPSISYNKNGSYAYLEADCLATSVRDDISDLYSRSEFILAPTYKTYLEMMKSIDMGGIKRRKENDLTPRRPMSSGLYRYIYIPCTDAARALQAKYNLQPQTQEDLNYGISPLNGQPYPVGSDQFPVVECHTHPFSICMLAYNQLRSRCTTLTGQWLALTGRIMDLRFNKDAIPPLWFINSPKVDEDDVELSPDEASGYDPVPSSGEYAIEPTTILREPKIPDTDPRKAVADWACNKIDPKAPPPPETPPRIEYKLRRSVRIRRKACPYGPPSPCRSGPPPSPTRHVPRALATCRRDLRRVPPAWVGRNGRFPTHNFSSNDWSFFCYGLNLAYTPPSGVRSRGIRYRMTTHHMERLHTPTGHDAYPNIDRLSARRDLYDLPQTYLAARLSLQRLQRPINRLLRWPQKPESERCIVSSTNVCKEDLNGGISPVHNKPFLEGSDQFPVIESLAHPFSICSWADTRFWRRSTSLTSQWHVLSSRIVNHWLYKQIKPPAWFVDAASYLRDDEDLTPSEATGYIISHPPHVARDHVEILKDVTIEEDNYCKKCAKWASSIPPNAPPPKEDPPQSVYRERRSIRIAKRVHPYHRPPQSSPPDVDCSGPLPSPTRKSRRALQTCKRDPIKNPPSWAARNGSYPTQNFCSNDWAYFRYNVYLASFAGR
ncbi:uncharacterized protein SCHCODRAFT_02483725 [Schizophyllum commune H4-8]|uniref:Uncharacterized protein n=1 Tax=Schizophyllum commune (strain H4-8 / FGSC 9210) TaxID=578458 RepID=D8PTZ8_SCHCM|nr:uncharacterized protein SCHCODRAFT_02483725 [Schizophyllum commune H4-8]KAI5900773.1 hypothetical protein SCHCODRAFT_02483725 [Schizophyllum commune H4-8]